MANAQTRHASGSESGVKSDDWSTTGMQPRAHLRGASRGAASSNATAATAAGLAAGPTESEGKTDDWGGGSSNTTAAVLHYDRMQDTKFESTGRSRNMPCGSATGGCSIAEAKQACAGYLACTGFWCQRLNSEEQRRVIEFVTSAGSRTPTVLAGFDTYNQSSATGGAKGSEGKSGDWGAGSSNTTATASPSAGPTEGDEGKTDDWWGRSSSLGKTMAPGRVTPQL